MLATQPRSIPAVQVEPAPHRLRGHPDHCVQPQRQQGAAGDIGGVMDAGGDACEADNQCPQEQPDAHVSPTAMATMPEATPATIASRRSSLGVLKTSQTISKAMGNAKMPAWATARTMAPNHGWVVANWWSARTRAASIPFMMSALRRTLQKSGRYECVATELDQDECANHRRPGGDGRGGLYARRRPFSLITPF